MADILVVGSLVTDLSATVEQFPKDGETLIAKSFYRALGGKGVNQAVAAARLGAKVEMCGCVGNDSYGEEFFDLLKKENIEHRFLFRSNKYQTGMAQIQINKDHQNRIVVISGANQDMTIDKVDLIDSAIKEAKIVMVQFEIPLETTKEVLRRAKKYGKTTIVNTAPGKLVDDEFLSLCDFVTPNDIEISLITGLPTCDIDSIKKAAKHLINKGVKHVLVTLGKDGAYILDEKYNQIIPSIKVDAIDTVGAGDSFNGAFATRLLETNDIIQSIKFAVFEGALTVTKQGAIPSLSTREELDIFIKNQ